MHTSERLRLLVDFVHQIQYPDLPAVVRRHAVKILLDTFGVIVWGAQDPFLSRFREQLLGNSNLGAATIVGSRFKTEAGSAALFNAAACTVTQIDEGHRQALGHPGIHIIPAILAVGERQDLSGAQLVSALVAGYEVAARIGRAMRPLRSGIHAHGHWPVIPAALATAKLLGADPAALHHCLESAATLTLFPAVRTATDGVTSHHLFAGLGAQIAVTVAYGSCAGMTGSPDLFADHFVPLSTEWFHPELLTEALDNGQVQFEILNSYFKFQPVCAHAITSIEAIDSIRPKITDPLAVERVIVRTYRLAAELVNQSPATALAAKFSIPYVIAARLLYPDSRLTALHQQDLSDPQLRDLMTRVVVLPDDTLDAEYPLKRPSVVQVNMSDGSRFTQRRDMPRGDADNPAPLSQLEAKFEELVAPVLGGERTLHLKNLLLHVGELNSIRELADAARLA